MAPLESTKLLEEPKKSIRTLEQYLHTLDLMVVAKVVFGGDGAPPWIGSGVEALCHRLRLDSDRVYPVVNYIPLSSKTCTGHPRLSTPVAAPSARPQWVFTFWECTPGS